MKLELVQEAYRNVTNKYLALTKRIQDQNLTEIVFTSPGDDQSILTDDPNKFDLLNDIDSILVSGNEPLTEPVEKSTTLSEPSPPYSAVSLTLGSRRSSIDETLI